MAYQVSQKSGIDFKQDQIYDFKPQQILGQGSYGVVFLCSSKKFKRKFAVKKSVFDPSSPEIGIVETFNLEGFCHHYISLVRLSALGINYQFNVMDVYNETLSRISKYMNDSLKLRSLAQIAEIIADMHSSFAYHGDIKENNILFKIKKTEIKFFLSDFGFSKIFDKRQEQLERKQIFSFLRIIYKMIGFDGEKYPKDIIYDEFYEFIQQIPKKKLKNYWKQIFQFTVPKQASKIPSMNRICLFIKSLIQKNSAYLDHENIEAIFQVYGDDQIDFQTDTALEIPEYTEPNPNSPQKSQATEFLEKIQTSTEKTKKIKKSVDVNVPKNMRKCLKARRIPVREQNLPVYCAICGKSYPRKYTYHKKFHPK